MIEIRRRAQPEDDIGLRAFAMVQRLDRKLACIVLQHQVVLRDELFEGTVELKAHHVLLVAHDARGHDE